LLYNTVVHTLQRCQWYWYAPEPNQLLGCYSTN